jgi:hypothetical protein
MPLLALKRKHVSRSGILAVAATGTWNRHNVAPGAVLLNPSREYLIGLVLVYMHIGSVLTLSCALALCFALYSPIARLLFYDDWFYHRFIRCLCFTAQEAGKYRDVRCRNLQKLKNTWNTSPSYLTTVRNTLPEHELRMSDTARSFSCRLLLQFQIIVLSLLHHRLKFVVHGFSSETDGHPTRKEVPRLLSNPTLA